MKKFFFVVVLLIMGLLISCTSEVNVNKKNYRKLKIHQIPSDIIYKNDTALELVIIGETYLHQENNLDSAELYFNESLRFEEHHSTYSNLALVKIGQHDISKGLELLDKAIELDSQHWLYYIQKSRFLIENKKYCESRKVLESFLNKPIPEYWTAYGNYYLAIGNMNDSVHCDSVKLNLRDAELLRSDTTLRENFLSVEQKIFEYCNKINQ